MVGGAALSWRDTLNAAVLTFLPCFHRSISSRGHTKTCRRGWQSSDSQFTWTFSVLPLGITATPTVMAGRIAWRSLRH